MASEAAAAFCERLCEVYPGAELEPTEAGPLVFAQAAGEWLKAANADAGSPRDLSQSPIERQIDGATTRRR